MATDCLQVLPLQNTGGFIRGLAADPVDEVLQLLLSDGRISDALNRKNKIVKGLVSWAVLWIRSRLETYFLVVAGASEKAPAPQSSDNSCKF